MKQIIKNILPYKYLAMLILVLLGVQAYCDLSLPQYTSDMIDVGIQNHGVQYILPEKITANEMQLSEIFMTEDEKLDWRSCYEADGDDYVRKTNSENRLESLSSSLLTPIVLSYQTGNTSEEKFKEFMNQRAAENPQLSGVDFNSLSISEISELMNIELKTTEAEDEDGNVSAYVDMRPLLLNGENDPNAENALLSMREQMEKTTEAIGSSTLRSMGIAYAISCDKAAGVNIDDLQKDYLWSQSFKMLLMSLLMLAASIGAGFLSARVGAGIGRDLRQRIFTRVIGYSNTEMDKFSTASLITRNTNDVQQIQMVTTMLLRMLMYAPIIGIGGVIKVINTKANMSWIIAAAVAAIFLLIAVLMSLAMPKFKIMQKLVDSLNLVSREILTGLPVIRAFGREKTEEERFDRANTKLMKTQLFTHRVMNFMMPGMSLVMYGVTLTIVWVSAHKIDAGTLQVGAMTAFITYSMQIVMSFLMLTMMSVMLPRAGVAADRIAEVLSTEGSVLDPENPEKPDAIMGRVTFENVSFSYPSADKCALENINFTAEPGETTAIIGSTGCGKSTLINLIPRFYDVTDGKVTIDGIDVRKLSKTDLRSCIGLVPQKGVLFSGTISSNLRFGKHDADENEIKKAAEIAQAMEFISTNSEGFERSIAQGGSNVSGGQKQRLAIARAIAKQPKIYIFDDSFSALDMKTDAALRKALGEHTSDSTVIIVAQRISTIMNANKIIVLNEGKIEGIGTHAELLKNCDTYLQIARSQLSESELNNSAGGEQHE